MKSNKISALAISSLLAASFSFPAFSADPQPAAAPAAAPAPEGMPMHEGMSEHEGKFNPAESKAKWNEYLKKLHDELKITADQEGAWKDYADSVMAQHDAWVKEFEKVRGTFRTMTAPERMKERVNAAEMNLPLLKTQSEKLNALYDKLSDHQKGLADALLIKKHPKMNEKHHGKKGEHHKNAGE